MTRAIPVLCVLLAVGLGLHARPAWAAPPPPEEEGETAAEPRLGGDAALRVLTAYYDDGFLQERDGVVYQPEVSLRYRLLSAGRWTISALGGLFASVDEYPTYADDPNGTWAHLYEVTWSVGAEAERDGLSIAASFERSTSPSGGYSPLETWTVELAYDDAGWLDGASLNPWLSVTVETLGALDGVDRGSMLALGLEPTLTVPAGGLGDLTFRFPLQAELSLSDYFQRSDGTNTTFGFFSMGAFVDVPLRGLPGEAALEVGVTGWIFGPALVPYNGREDAAVLSVGLTVSF